MNDKFTTRGNTPINGDGPGTPVGSISPFESVVLSGALIVDDETKTFNVNEEQLRDYLSAKQADDLFNPIMNLITNASIEIGYSLQVLRDSGAKHA